MMDIHDYEECDPTISELLEALRYVSGQLFLKIMKHLFRLIRIFSLILVSSLLFGCGDPQNTENAGWAGFLIAITSLQPEQKRATDEERKAYAHEEAQRYWAKHGYEVDRDNMPIGYYKDYQNRK